MYASSHTTRKFQLQLPSQSGKLMVEHYEYADDAPTIIFLHDSLGCIALWWDFPKRLAKSTACNYLVYDRLGYGASSRKEDLPHRSNDYMEKEADVLLELIASLNIRKALLFGHSDGGTIALLAAAKKPAQIMGIITEGAHIFVEDITLQGIRAVKENYYSSNLRERLARYHGERVDDVFHAWTDTWLRSSFRSWNIEHFLSGITCPALIIQGEEDEFGSLKQVEAITNQVIGSAQKVVLKNVAHTPHKEDLSNTLNYSTSFIKELERPSDPSQNS